MTIAWNYYNGTGTANITLFSLSNASHIFSTGLIPDAGSFIGNLSQVSPSPGIYYVVITNAFGTGNSNQFAIDSPTGLNVSLNSTFAIHDTTADFNVTWVPTSNVGTANISIYSYALDNTTVLATDVLDNGGYTVSINYPEGSYFIFVKSSIGNGSATFTFTGPVTAVTATPNNISTTNALGTSNTISNITWTPLSSDVNASFAIGNNSCSVVLNISNTGLYVLNATDFGLAPSQYFVSIGTSLGSGFNTLTVYKETGLIITFPTPTTIAYNDSTAFNVSWTPFYAAGPLTNITFQDLNTGTSYVFTVPNSGSELLNLTSQNLPASSYNITVTSALGSGLYNNFTLRYAQYLTIFTPNITTVVPNNGTLLATWGPTDLAGGDAVFYIYNAYNSSYVYGPFFRVDNGTTKFDLSIPSKSFLRFDVTLPENLYKMKAKEVAIDFNALKRKIIRI